MSSGDVSDDELVFLIRQNNDDALTLLQDRMRPKQDRLIRKLLRDNRYCGLEHGDLLTIAMQSLHTAIDSYEAKKSVFDAYYHFLLERDLVNEMKKYNTFNQMIINTSISLDQSLEDGGTLYDLIGCHDEKIKDTSKGDILELAESEDCDLTSLEKSILAYRILGYSFTDIGKIFNRSYRQISRIVERIGTKHRHRFED